MSELSIHIPREVFLKESSASSLHKRQFLSFPFAAFITAIHAFGTNEMLARLETVSLNPMWTLNPMQVDPITLNIKDRPYFLNGGHLNVLLTLVVDPIYYDIYYKGSYETVEDAIAHRDAYAEWHKAGQPMPKGPVGRPKKEISNVVKTFNREAWNEACRLHKESIQSAYTDYRRECITIAEECVESERIEDIELDALHDQMLVVKDRITQLRKAGIIARNDALTKYQAIKISPKPSRENYTK